MTAPIRLEIVPTAPIAVERELAGLLSAVSQQNVGAVVGLADHTPISKRMAKVVTGKADSYGDALTFNQGIKLARAHAPLALQVSEYVNGAVGKCSPASICAEVSREIGDDAALIADCNAALADGKIDRAERRRLVAALRESMNRRATLILHLDAQGD